VDDPRRSCSVTNSLSQLQDDYETGSDSVIACTPEKKFEEQDGPLDGSEFHTPAQLSKRRRLPSASPPKTRRVADSETDSVGIDRYSLFESTPTRKRGFKRPRQPWSLVKEWQLEKYDRKVAYEEIKTILGQSLDEDGSKTFIRPNANSIAGWRVKQVSYFLLSILLFMILIVVLHCRIMWHATKPRRSIRLVVLFLIDAAAMSNFEFLRPQTSSSWNLRVSIRPRVMFKTRFQSF
jgi:hypothetical protein